MRRFFGREDEVDFSEKGTSEEKKHIPSVIAIGEPCYTDESDKSDPGLEFGDAHQNYEEDHGAAKFDWNSPEVNIVVCTAAKRLPTPHMNE